MKKKTKIFSMLLALAFLSAGSYLDAQTLSPGAKLLFKNINTKISVGDKNEIFAQCGLYYNETEKKISPGKGLTSKGFTYDVYPTDMNKDAIEEIFVYKSVQKGNKSNASVDILLKENGRYLKCGKLSSFADVYKSQNYGYNDLGEFGVSKTKIYRFNGTEYREYSGQIGEWIGGLTEFSLDYTFPIKTISNPAIVTPYIFRNNKTKLSQMEKEAFTNGYVIEYRDNGDTTLKFDFDGEGKNFERAYLDIFPTDLNKDGVEEIFTRTNSTFFGQWLQPLVLYIKGRDGKYSAQEFLTEGDTSPRLYERAARSEGYPDLIGAIPQGPGFYDLPTTFNVYRWNGTEYKFYKQKQPYLKTDKSIEEVISPAYQASLPDSLLKNIISFHEPESNSSTNAASVPDRSSSSNVATTSESKEPATIEKSPTLSPIAESLFKNVKTKLTTSEKNDIAYVTGIKQEELDAKTKKGKPKYELNIYPVDFNNDGEEEIFLCITSKPLVIAMHTYCFYGKNHAGKYQALPGKIGQGARILLNGKTGFPDLVTGTPGFDREVWSWNGQTYQHVQNIPGKAPITYQTKNIDDASKEYVDQPITVNSVEKFHLFDGEWYSPDYQYSFKIKGKTGVATLSNSTNYHIGDIMLKIQNLEGDVYHGQQIYTDGVWHDVTLKKAGNNLIEMKGGVGWNMKRIK